ncbi:MAG: hypothetical protein AAGA30_01100 [Planctomycetota bacterium]
MNPIRTHQQKLPVAIRGSLAKLRSRLTLWLMVKGLSRWLVILLLILAADMLIDRIFKFDLAQRIIMLVLMVSATAMTFFWRVMKPLSRTISDDALLLEVEAKNPDFKENLISGAQLATMENAASHGVSTELLNETVRKGVALAEQTDFSQILNRKKLFKNGAVLCSCLAFLSALVVAIGTHSFFSTWFNRNILLGSAQWPQATYLNIIGANDGILVLPRGSDHRLRVEVTEDSRVQDVEVTLEIENSGTQAWHTMKPTGRLEGREHSFILHNVSSEMKLTARGGDATTAMVKIELVEPPAILDLDLVATLPDYTKAAPKKLEGPGPHSLLDGSRVTANATVNKPLSEFKLKSSQQEFPLVQNAEDLSYSVSIPADEEKLAGGQYQFSLIDETGLAAIRPSRFVISLKDDLAPKTLASLLGISNIAVPRVRIPVSYNAKDDYGLSEIYFHCNWKYSDTGEKAGTGGNRDLEIENMKNLNEPIRQRRDVAVLDLEPFQFEPGTSFKLRVRSLDTRPPEANEGDSEEFLIRIVSEEELRADLLRREIEQRKAFQRAYDAQLELTSELQAVAAMIPQNQSAKEFEADRQNRMLNLSREQKLVGTGLDAIAKRFEEFLVESQNNRLDEDEAEFVGRKSMADRFDNEIIRPIRRLDQELVATAVRELDNCRRFLNQNDQLMIAVDQSGQLHQQILTEMQKIMSAMKDSENFQEVINKLLEIKRGENQIKAEIKRRKPAETDVFDEDDIFDDN